MKKKSGMRWWPWIVGGVVTPAILIPLAASLWSHVQSVWAGPARDKEHEERLTAHEQVQQQQAEQTTAIYKWIEEEQKRKDYEAEREAEREAEAPPGYQWNAVTKKYETIRRK